MSTPTMTTLSTDLSGPIDSSLLSLLTLLSSMKRVYFNEPQMLTQLIAANTTVIVAGRRTGKTDSIAAPFLIRCIQRMPRSSGGIVVPTYRHGLTNTIPGIVAALERWGYKQGVHFVVGRKPPANFARPIIPPQNYSRVISFVNGSVAILISQDRAGSSNGLTLSWLLIDEAKFIDFRQLKEETIPANGGIKSHFGRHACNHSMMILSDMPQTKRGSWFLNYREKMDPEVIDMIKALVAEDWRLRERLRLRDGDPARIARLLRVNDRDLNRFRRIATYYREYSSIENIELLGEEYIRQMKRDLTPLTFQTSILCKRITSSRDGYYACLSDRHFYDADNPDFLDSASGLCLDVNSISSAVDSDINPNSPIAIGMDFGANINWMVAGQPLADKLRVLKSFFSKYERKLPELVSDFCSYYSGHKNKTVIFYYDSTAIGRNAVNSTTYYSVVVESFEAHGWTVRPVYIGHPMRHDEKYLLINQGLKGRQRLMPCFNRQNNEPLILALQAAGVERGRLGFRKDKSGEKFAESEEDLLEHRTDGTDAFDTLYIGCENFPQSVIQYFASGIG